MYHNLQYPFLKYEIYFASISPDERENKVLGKTTLNCLTHTLEKLFLVVMNGGCYDVHLTVKNSENMWLNMLSCK